MERSLIFLRGRAIFSSHAAKGIVGRRHGFRDGDDLVVLGDDEFGFTGFDGAQVFGAVGFEIRNRDFLLLDRRRLHELGIKLTTLIVNY